MRTRKRKAIIVSTLIIAIIGLSIGFAVFSSTLNIQTRANITPVGEFNIIFASEASKEDTLNYKTDTYVERITEGNAEATNPEINNTGNPRISNLNVSFKAPGDKVTYTFYVVNAGEYDAYLTNLIFNNVLGASEFRECVESGENPASNLNSVCNNINFSVKIGNENPISTTSTLNNHSLLKQTYETVIVTISYQGDIYADGSFEVNFGDIELQYKSVDEPVEIAEENPWPVRGLKSAKVRYNKSYEIQNENEEMPEEITVYDNGALVADKSYTSNQVDNLISQSKVAVSNDNIIMKTESDSYMAIVFVEEDTTDVYLAPSNVAEFDTQSIVNNATTSATFEATSEEENPWIVTRGMDPKYVVFDSNYVSDGTPVMPLQYISLKSNGDLDLAGDIKDSSSVDDGIPNEMLVGTNYVIVRQSDSNIAFEFNKDYILTYMSTNTQDLTLDDIKENDVMESIAVNNSKSRRYVLSQ